MEPKTIYDAAFPSPVALLRYKLSNECGRSKIVICRTAKQHFRCPTRTRKERNNKKISFDNDGMQAENFAHRIPLTSKLGNAALFNVERKEENGRVMEILLAIWNVG